MKNKYVKLKSMLLAGTMLFTSAGLTGCESYRDNSNIIVLEREMTHFDIGEHIISIPIPSSEDIRTKNYQYEYHPGYEPIGISITAYGKAANNFGGGSIIYVNTEEVDCSTNVKDKDGNYVYIFFGASTDSYEEDNSLDSQTKEFGVGEHIISVPITDDNRLFEIQYEVPDGYEVVGIASSAHGMSANSFGGGVLLYKNIVPVVCVLGDDGYTSFGVPKEMENNRTIK